MLLALLTFAPLAAATPCSTVASCVVFVQDTGTWAVGTAEDTFWTTYDSVEPTLRETTDEAERTATWLIEEVPDRAMAIATETVGDAQEARDDAMQRADETYCRVWGTSDCDGLGGILP